ncbi:hypothetical protein J43TS9_31440 [Paenibacillus cineris]|nr:hypothetical protein J43TS9_31440 [Paenibacillus cineris]
MKPLNPRTTPIDWDRGKICYIYYADGNQYVDDIWHVVRIIHQYIDVVKPMRIMIMGALAACLRLEKQKNRESPGDP